MSKALTLHLGVQVLQRLLGLLLARGTAATGSATATTGAGSGSAARSTRRGRRTHGLRLGGKRGLLLRHGGGAGRVDDDLDADGLLCGQGGVRGVLHRRAKQPTHCRR